MKCNRATNFSSKVTAITSISWQNWWRRLSRAKRSRFNTLNLMTPLTICPSLPRSITTTLRKRSHNTWRLSSSNPVFMILLSSIKCILGCWPGIWLGIRNCRFWRTSVVRRKFLKANANPSLKGAHLTPPSVLISAWSKWWNAPKILTLNAKKICVSSKQKFNQTRTYVKVKI